MSISPRKLGKNSYSFSISNCLGIFYVYSQKHTGLTCFSSLSEGLDIHSGSPISTRLEDDVQHRALVEPGSNLGLCLYKTQLMNECQGENPSTALPPIQVRNNGLHFEREGISLLIKTWAPSLVFKFKLKAFRHSCSSAVSSPFVRSHVGSGTVDREIKNPPWWEPRTITFKGSLFSSLEWKCCLAKQCFAYY